MRYAKDMIQRHYGDTSLRDPRIVQELGADLPFEHTAAGQYLGLVPASTASLAPNPASAYSSAAPGPGEVNGEKSKQEKLKQDLPNRGPPNQ